MGRAQAGAVRVGVRLVRGRAAMVLEASEAGVVPVAVARAAGGAKAVGVTAMRDRSALASASSPS